MKGPQRYEKENKFADWTKQGDNINNWEKTLTIPGSAYYR